VAINCASVSTSLLESELFGHEEGAFTGATHKKPGLIETARGGTLFLDEVGEMSTALQPKLLRVLQEGELRRVGGVERVAIDVRIVCATHRDLEALVAAGRFRADLFYRLNVMRIELPPLRERVEDLPPLIERFVARAPRPLRFEPLAREMLLNYSWPGNVRELENEIRRLAVLVADDGVVRPGLLSPAILGRPPAPDVQASAGGVDGVWRLEELEREMVQRALAVTEGKKAAAARLLGIPKTSLYRKIERYGLS
jgi:transcriptional regulator with PAS, ATPase and Fis domain